MSKSTVEVLRDARAKYAGNPSHAPAGQRVPDGLHCAATAIGMGSDEDDGPAERALAGAAGMPLCNPRWEIIVWNAGHTTEAVLAAFDRAIANEEAKAQEFTASPVEELAPA